MWIPPSLPKILVCFAVVFLVKFPLVAQKNLDSLRSELKQQEGLEKGRTWQALALATDAADYEMAIAGLDSAARIFLDLGQKEDWLITQGYKVQKLVSQELNYRAEQVAEQILPNLDQIDSLDLRNKFRNAIGNMQANLGEPAESVPLFLTSLESYRKAQDTSGILETMQDLAIEYYNYGSERQAYQLQDSALTIAQDFSGKDPELLAGIYNNLASYLLGMGNQSAALDVAEKGIQEAKKTEKASSIINPYFTKGEISLAVGDLRQAAQYFRLSGELLPDLDRQETQALALEAKSIYFTLMRNPDSTDYWLNRCLAKIDSVDDVLQKWETLVLRSEVLSAMGDYGEALVTYKEVGRLKDTLFSRENSRQVEEFRIMYATQQAEEENARLRESNALTQAENRRNTRFFLVILLLILTIGGLMAYFLIFSRKLNRSISDRNNELARQNKRLKQLTGENELLMGIVAHDLKAPLSKIQGLMGLLTVEGNLSGGQEKAVDMMESVLQGGQELVADILILSEAGQGRQPDLECQDLASIMSHMRDQFLQSAQQKSIDIQLSPVAQNTEALVYRPYLIRVLDNLLSNAIKFSHPGSVVELSWGRDKQGSWCAVQDRGPGIAQDDVPKLFQRFARLKNRPTAGESSTGLGLYIVKVLLEATQATIHVDTEVGQGTRFTLRFPDQVQKSRRTG